MIYIPTLARVDRQVTASSLKLAGVPYKLVCREEEADLLRGRGHDVLVEPKSTLRNGVGHTRQFIMNHDDNESLIMMDDDLVFARRGKRTDNPMYLSPCEPSDIVEMVNWLESKVVDGSPYAMAGVSSREGNNRKENDFAENTRMMRVLSINKDKFVKSGADFSSVPLMDDFDVTLSLLLAGYPNIETCIFTNNQHGSNMNGGCQNYRTLAIHGATAKALAAKYPLFVQAVEKETKNSWGGGVRTDVKVYWKKAYQSSQKGK